MRVTAQLADAGSGQQVWAERYDRDLDDIFALQDELSREVVTSTAVPVHMVLAACMALAGEQEAAAEQMAESRRLNPDLSITYVAEQIPYRRSEDRDRWLAGLRKAGPKE